MSAKKSFVQGAFILAAAGLIGKVIGMFYKIWLTGLITEEGMGFYQSPYSLYQLLLVLSSAGLPTAISKMVAERAAVGDRLAARTIFRKTRKILFFTGFAAMAFMILLAKPITAAFGDPAAAPGFVALAPALFFVCILSAYRGYFQGQQDMTPTALSQVVEQVGKVTLGFGLAIALRKYGLVWGAVGAILGVTLSELIAMLYMMALSMARGRREAPMPRGDAQMEHLYRRLFAIAIPVSIGACMMPIVGLVDTSLVQNRLLDLGYAARQARAMYGVLSANVTSIVNMPAVITLSFSMSLVPMLSACVTQHDTRTLQATTKTGLKLALLIGSAAAVGMGMLAPNIFALLFNHSVAAENLILGGRLLAIMSVAVLFLSVVQTTTGMLQGLGKPIYPVVTLLIGIVVKIVLNVVLIGIPSLNVAGAAYATVACYAIAAVGNLYMVLRLTGVSLNVGSFLFRPAAAAGGMALSLWGFGKLLGGRLGNTSYTLGAVCVGVAVYLALAVLTGALSRQDLDLMPGGRKIARLMDKFARK